MCHGTKAKKSDRTRRRRRRSRGNVGDAEGMLHDFRSYPSLSAKQKKGKSLSAEGLSHNGRNMHTTTHTQPRAWTVPSYEKGLQWYFAGL